MQQRLQKRIAQAGIASRRKAEELIVSGAVKVNGIVVTQLGVLVEDQDDIQVFGKTIKSEKKVTYLLNKPARVLSSVSDDRNRRCVTEFIPDKNRLYPIGRLDYDTTGLLLLTNDGQLANKLIHPRYHLPKKYHVKLRGTLQDYQIEQLKKGLKTKEESYQPAFVSQVKIDTEKKQTHFDIVIYEGKNRQIRKMMEFFHHEVLKLHRYQLGPLTLDKLGSGQYRKLTEEELELLLLASEKGKA